MGGAWLWVGVFGVLLVGNAVADRDTVPLKQKTLPTSNESTNDSSAMLSRPGKATLTKPTAQEVEKNMLDAMPKPYVAAVDTFGSSRISETSLRQFLGKDLEAWFGKGLAGDPNSLKLEEQLLERIQKKWGFALAKFSIMQFYTPGDLAVYITLDVVEKDDASARMTFLPAPTGELRDPDGLIKKWMEYEDLALGMIEVGQLEPESAECVALHCPFGHKHLKLRPYEKVFVEGAAAREKDLVELLNKDKRDEVRASAAFLLAYLKEGRKVVGYLVDRIKDPSDHVRNNALRVLGDIAEFHPEFPVPVRPIIDALNFPRVTDRAKASYVAYLLALNSQQAKEEILRTGVPNLLRLLASKQPDQRELAHSTLRKVSGKEYPSSDLASWNNWFTKLAKDRGLADTRTK